ncbi:MAG: hypothetical protein ABGY13_01035 [Verrucomicrobiia bacterium]
MAIKNRCLAKRRKIIPASPSGVSGHLGCRRANLPDEPDHSRGYVPDRA